MARQQTEKDIKHLSGLSKIRNKVSMYLGSSDGTAMWTALREALDNGIDEVNQGRNDAVTLVKDPDNKCGYWIVDNGGGMPVKDITVTEETTNKKVKISALKALVYLVHAGGKFENSDSTGGLRGTHGIGTKCLNAVSDVFTVYTKRDGQWYMTSYERGVEVEEVQTCTAPTVPNISKPKQGTVIYAELDPTVFDNGSKIDTNEITSWFETTSFFTEGVSLRYVDARGKVQEWEGQDPLDTLLADVEENKANLLAEDAYFTASDKFWDLSLAFTDLDGVSLNGYAAGLYNQDGGHHVNTVFKVVSDVVSQYAGKKQSFNPTDLREGLIGSINIKLSAIKFHNQEKTKLVDERCGQPLYDEIYPVVEDFFKKKKELAKQLCERASRINDLKADFKANKAVLKVFKEQKKRNALPTKLVASVGCTAEERELYIVEGDSAGGSAKRARDASYQEVLPIKGKIKNPFKQSATDSEELLSLLMALGYDPNKENPAEELRVGKLILLTDGDVDGLHIQTLIIGAILAYIPEMFEQGRVYACLPYEYMVEHKGEYYFSIEKQELMQQVPASAHSNISHIKGWGERLPLSSYIYTSEGLVTLGDVTTSHKVETTTGLTHPELVHEYPPCSAKFLKTSFGLGLRSSDNHPVMVMTKDCHIVWKKAKDVLVGDYLALDRGVQCFPDYTPRFMLPTYKHRDTTVTFPKYMTTELARLLGYWVADGCGSDIHCGVDYDYAEDVKYLFEHLFSGCTAHIEPMHNNNTSGWSVRVGKGGAAVYRFFEHLELGNMTAYNKEIPVCIRESSKEYMAAFLQGLFEGDGYASDCKIEYYTASPELFKQVVVALNNFGVICKCEMQDNRYNPFTGSTDEIPSNQLWIHGGFIDVFNREIGFFSERKRSVFKKNHYSNVDCIPYLGERLRYFKSFCVGNNKGVRQYDYNGRTFSVELGHASIAKNITYNQLAKMSRIDNVREFDPKVAEAIAFCREVQPFWTEVLSVDDYVTNEDFGDLTLPVIDDLKGSSYVADGYVVHNCNHDVLSEMAFNSERRRLYRIMPDDLRKTQQSVRALMESEGGTERKKLLGLS